MVINIARIDPCLILFGTDEDRFSLLLFQSSQ